MTTWEGQQDDAGRVENQNKASEKGFSDIPEITVEKTGGHSHITGIYRWPTKQMAGSCRAGGKAKLSATPCSIFESVTWTKEKQPGLEIPPCPTCGRNILKCQNVNATFFFFFQESCMDVRVVL